MLKKGFLSLVLLGLSGASTPALALDNLILNGYLSEWTNTESLGVDGNDITVANAKADILQAWASHDSNNLQIAYRNDGPIDNVWWPWQVFIDTDRDTSTGFRAGNGIGAEYMLQGNQLRRYTGDGSSWAWQGVRNDIGVKRANNAEFSLTLNELGNPGAINLFFKASNSAFTGSFENSGIDTFPNSGAGLFTINTESNIAERSNALTPQIDGDLSDWSGTTSFGRDGDDISVANTQADIIESWMANDSEYLYLAYTNDGPINFGTWWPWQTYFDTDNNPNTGFKTGGLGVDFILQGNGLRRYTGTGTNWSWAFVANAEFANGNTQTELRILRSAIGNPEAFKLQLKARNNPFINSFDPAALDDLPNSGAYSYRMAETNSEVVSNALTPTLDGNLNDWSQTTSFGIDGNDISAAGAQADWLEAWMAHDSNNLYIAYKNDGPINTGTWWPWQVYLDTDNNPQTGYLNGGIGADFILQGKSLARYTGNGSNWSWESQAVVDFATGDSGKQVELKLPRSVLGNTSDIKVRLIARNVPFTGNFDASGVDVYTGTGGSSVLAYRVGEADQLPPSPARYRLTFNATWNASDSTLAFPNDPHFSGLIGATHKSNASLWSRGTLASNGIKQMAETGAKAGLRSEIAALINQGSACAEINGGGVSLSPGSVSVTFTAQPECSLVSVVSMLAPSPDWFVGSNAINLVNNGQWRDRVVHNLRTYDSGTDSGATFTAPNLVTSPPRTIQLAPELPGLVGNFTFERL